jgi:hypothetical protein
MTYFHRLYSIDADNCCLDPAHKDVGDCLDLLQRPLLHCALIARIISGGEFQAPIECKRTIFDLPRPTGFCLTEVDSSGDAERRRSSEFESSRA